MTDKQLPPDWAISKAMQETEMLFRAAGLGNVYDGMLIRARELSAQQPDAARGEPKCPACGEVVQFECIACSTNNYPQAEPEQPARDGVALPDGWCTLGVGSGNGKLFVHGDYESIKACQRLITQPPQPTDGEAAGWFAKNRFDAWEEVDPQHAGEPGVVQLYLRPSRGVDVTDGYDPNELLRAARNLIAGLMGGGKTDSGDLVLVDRIDQHLAALSGVQR